MKGASLAAWLIMLACAALLLLPFGLNAWAQWRLHGKHRNRITLIAGWITLAAACGPALSIAFAALRWHGHIAWTAALVYGFSTAAIATGLSLFCSKSVRSLLFLAGALSLLNTYLVGILALG